MQTDKIKKRKKRVDEVMHFDIQCLTKSSIVEMKPKHIYQFERSGNLKDIKRIHFKLISDSAGNPSELNLYYEYEQIPYNYQIRFDSTKCHYGGARWWFLCPSIDDKDAPCKRRCTKLYFIAESGYFGCRECANLTYESRQRHRDEFYEYFEKPHNQIKIAFERMNKPGSSITKLRAAQKIKQAEQKIFIYMNKFYKQRFDELNNYRRLQ